jgi:hypothetical protein
MSPVTSITLLPRGPGGVEQTLDLTVLRDNSEGLLQAGCETKAEQAFCVVVMALIDTIWALNDLLEEEP